MSSPATSQPVVWVIDDDDVESLLIKEALLRTRRDCRIHAVSDRPSVRASLTDPEIPRPNLVILDYFLPTCEAPDVLPLLREHLGWTPIVVLSGLSEQADINRCLAAHASLFVKKPASYAGLSNALARICDVYLNIGLFP